MQRERKFQEKKAVIILGYRCNNRCVFCIHENRDNLLNRTTQEIVQEMERAKELGNTYLEFIGGETTIRKDILFLVKTAKQLGFETICIATNGRMLSYKKFAKELFDAGITALIFSIHGHTAELHDLLTRAEGSFDQLIQGIRNMQELGFNRFGTNTTIVKQNYKILPDIGRFILSLGFAKQNSEFIFVDPMHGGAFNRFDELSPQISEVAPYIKECLELGREFNDNITNLGHWVIRYVPLCYFKDYLEQISEIQELRLFKTIHLAPDYENYDVENSRRDFARAKTDKCKLCVYYKICEGIWKKYLDVYGDKELIPVLKSDLIKEKKSVILK